MEIPVTVGVYSDHPGGGLRMQTCLKKERSRSIKSAASDVTFHLVLFPALNYKMTARALNRRHRSPLHFQLMFAASLCLLLFASKAWATPEYSSRSGQSCKTCHLEGMGGPLSDTGLEFAASGYKWPPTGGYRVLGPIRKSGRFAIGFLHIAAAFMWFGTILYVHIMLRPAYASKGLPRGEMLLGLLSMLTVGVTGVMLTLSRIRSLEVLYHSPWGITLSIKILIYMLMVSSAILVVTVVGPRLRPGLNRAARPKDGVYGPVTLSAFDGKEGRPAMIAFKGKVYDVSGLKLWNGGIHMKHSAGADMTHAIGKAPHGEEKLDNLVIVGAFDPALQPRKTAAQKIFYIIAYMNLFLVFAVILTISYWRWGL